MTRTELFLKRRQGKAKASLKLVQKASILEGATYSSLPSGSDSSGRAPPVGTIAWWKDEWVLHVIMYNCTNLQALHAQGAGAIDVTAGADRPYGQTPLEFLPQKVVQALL